MDAGVSPLLFVNLLASFAAAAFVGFFYRRRRTLRGGRLLTLVALSVMVWAGCYSVSMLVSTFEAKLFWYRLRYLGNGFGALAWFVFVTRYSGHGSLLTRRRIVALVGVEAVGVVALWTNQTPFAPGLHSLWYQSVTTATVNGLTIVNPAPGVLLWVYLALNGLLFLLAAGFLFELVLRPEQRGYRGRNVALLAGSFVPFVLNISFQLLGEPLDPTPIGLTVTMLFVAYAVFGFSVSDVAPVARSSVVEALDVGVVVYDETGVVTDSNRLATRILGGDEGNLVGQSIPTVLAESTALDGSAGDLSVAALTGTHTEAVLEYVPADSPRVYEVRISALDGGTLGYVALLYDVTDHRAREQRLETQNRRLEEFAGIVSHDLRNPLNVASGYLHMARESSDNEFLVRVDSALHRMGVLIDDLLTLARSGRAIGETQSVALDTVARAAWENVHTETATLTVAVDQVVEADPIRLGELFENLYRNSVEHAGSDVSIRVGSTPVGFYVEDDGQGLSADEGKRVFERGYTTSQMGTGFGLAIVREVADAHGWTVELTEGRDGGVRFEFQTLTATTAQSAPT